METILFSDKNEWNNFLAQSVGSFLQSFEWGEFRQGSEGATGSNVLRLRVVDNGEVLLQSQVIKESFSFKSYFYIPFGPVFENNISAKQKQNALNSLFKKIKELAINEGCVFLRVEPTVSLGVVNGFKILSALKRVQPRKTLILDLSKTEEELQKDFKQKTRQNINFALKSGVEVVKKKNLFEDFYKLMQKTKERREFGIHSRLYYENILKISEGRVQSELFSALFKGKVINSAIALFFGNRATTLHAGSDYEYRHFKSANLLYWEIILEAKRRGLKELDFWGIDEKKWPGITIFKKGFGGEEFEYPQGIDIVFQEFWYSVYKIIKVIRRII